MKQTIKRVAAWAVLVVIGGGTLLGLTFLMGTDSLAMLAAVLAVVGIGALFGWAIDEVTK